MVRIPRIARTVRLALSCAGLLAITTAPAAAQPRRLVTRAEAVAATLARGPRLAVAAADTGLAGARLRTARSRPNPVLVTSYSRSVPQYHVDVELPIDLPGLRGARIGAATAEHLAARRRLEWARASLALEADTLYTRALAARDRARLSLRTAVAADSLRLMAVGRRDAGDASELDVALAMVNAGQAANVAAADSLDYLSLLLDLQAVMGLAGDSVAVVPTDSLHFPALTGGASMEPLPAGGGIAGRPPASPGADLLTTAAARASLAAAQLATRLQRRSLFAAPSITAGFETGDPDGVERGLLPTVGLALPLPVLNRNRGPIAEAVAAETQARAELALAELETRTELARLRRERDIAREKVVRDTSLVDAADRVAGLSLIAYREGAVGLAVVLEAQRNARELLVQYVDDLAALWIALAELRTLTLIPENSAP